MSRARSLLLLSQVHDVAIPVPDLRLGTRIGELCVHPASGARRGGARLHELLLPAVTTTARKTSRAAMALAAIALSGCGGESSRSDRGMESLSCADEDATGLGVGPDPRGYGTRGST